MKLCFPIQIMSSILDNVTINLCMTCSILKVITLLMYMLIYVNYCLFLLNFDRVLLILLKPQSPLCKTQNAPNYSKYRIFTLKWH